MPVRLLRQAARRAAANYTFTYVSGSVTVNPATVQITASSPTVSYGSAVPTITPSFSTFQNGQTSSVLTTQPTCTTTYTVASNAGSSPSTSCSGAAAVQLTLTYRQRVSDGEPGHSADHGVEPNG